MPTQWKEKTREQKDKANAWGRIWRKNNPPTREQRDIKNKRDRLLRKTSLKQIETTKIRKESIKTWYFEYKKTLFCKNCGILDWRVLQFHHRDPKTKINSVVNMVKNYNSIPKILAEIAKCDILCANCHIIHHAEEENHYSVLGKG